MSASKITSLFMAIMMSILNIIPGAYLFTEFCSMFYVWSDITETIVDALEERDSETLFSLASPSMKKQHPNLVDDLDEMFSSIKGNILAEEDSVYTYNQEANISLEITTSDNVYLIGINYRAFDAKTRQKELGIRRIFMSEQTDELGSRWINPENFFATDDINTECSAFTRIFKGAKDKTQDGFVFIVPEDDGILINSYHNVEIEVYRSELNEDYSSYRLNKEDEVTLYLVKEGKKPSDFSYKFKFKGTDKSSDKDCDIRKGNYYLYIESNNPDILYDIRVSANF